MPEQLKFGTEGTDGGLLRGEQAVASPNHGRLTGDNFTVRRAMVLAAGYGTRLRPITDHMAKPLIPIVGRPLLEIIVGRLVSAGFSEIALNTHHLANQIAQCVENLDLACRFTLFHEPEILGTGGGLVNARDFLSREGAFLLHNADVLTNLDLAELCRSHNEWNGLVTLALCDFEPANTVLLAEDGEVLDISGRLARRPPPGSRSLTYSGIAVLAEEVLSYLPTVGYSSLVDGLLQAIKDRPGAVRGFAPASVFWNDLGTVGRYLDAHAHLLSTHGSPPLGLGLGRGSVYRSESVEVAPDAVLKGFVSLGRYARVEPGARLRDCVVLDGGLAQAGGAYCRAVIGRGWAVFAEGERVVKDEEVVGRRGDEGSPARPLGPEESSEGFTPLFGLSLLAPVGLAPGFSAQPITGHGSDRSFWRLQDQTRRFVLMRTTEQDEEFDRYLAVAKFLFDFRLGGPAIVAVDAQARAVLMEDLGDLSLFRWVQQQLSPLKSPLVGESQEIETVAPSVGAAQESSFLETQRIYRRVIDLLVDLQVCGTAALDHCPPAGDRLFDYQTLRWETDYFRRRFLIQLVDLAPEEVADLDEEFHSLAAEALTQPVVLMHRDFQSQNIFLKDGQVRLVDFQGVRRGPLAYDLMSLLRDAYVDLGSDLLKNLRDYYRQRLERAGGPSLSADQLERMATIAGLQRNMQALGAFAYLSLVKRKKTFRGHVPLGLRHLAAGLDELRTGGKPGRCPRLEKIVARVSGKLSHE
jgi:NDP-sugar pyrophosphorylase family protein/aminoglycoside/choline kinase family phosphotransferase